MTPPLSKYTPAKSVEESVVTQVGSSSKKAYASSLSAFKEDIQRVISSEVEKMLGLLHCSSKDSIITLDIHQAKVLFSDSSKILPKGTMRTKALDLSSTLQYGFQLLIPDEILPPTFQEKVMKMDNRQSAVKHAAKAIDEYHKLFGGIYKIIQRVKEFSMEAENYRSFIEEDLISRQEEHNQRISELGSQFAASYSEKMMKEIADFSAMAKHVGKLKDLAGLLIDYYHRYIGLVIEEYGENSFYKSSFADEEIYITSLWELLGKRKPLLLAEKRVQSLSLSVKRSQVVDGERSPQSSGRSSPAKPTICMISANGTLFKFMPFASGVEFAVNLLHRIFIDLSIGSAIPLTSSMSGAHTVLDNTTGLGKSTRSQSIQSMSSVTKSNSIVSPQRDSPWSTNRGNSAFASFQAQQRKATVAPPIPRTTVPQEIGKVIDFLSQSSEFTEENINKLILSSHIVKRRKLNFLKIVDKSSALKNAKRASQPPRAVFYEWSPYFTAENLNDVTVSDKHVKQVALKTFSAAFLTCLIAEIVQAKAENICTSFVQSVKQKDVAVINFTGFNVDLFFTRSLFSSPVSSASPAGMLYEGSNALFTLPQMDSPLHPDVVNYLLQSKLMPEKIVCRWLREMHIQNKKYESLMKLSGFTAEDMQLLKLPIRLPEKAATTLYQKLVAVCNMLSANNQDTTHSSLLQSMRPPVELQIRNDMASMTLDVDSLMSISNRLYSVSLDNFDQEKGPNKSGVPLLDGNGGGRPLPIPFPLSRNPKASPGHLKSASADDFYFLSTDLSPKNLKESFDGILPSPTSDATRKRQENMVRRDVESVMWNPLDEAGVHGRMNANSSPPPIDEEKAVTMQSHPSHPAAGKSPATGRSMQAAFSFFQSRSSANQDKRHSPRNPSNSREFVSIHDIEENVGHGASKIGGKYAQSTPPSANKQEKRRGVNGGVATRHSRSHSSSGSYMFNDIYGKKSGGASNSLSSSSRGSIVLYQDSPLKVKEVAAQTWNDENLTSFKCSVEEICSDFVR